MAIAFDASVSVQGSGVTSLETASFTISGSNRYAVVNVSGSAGTPAAPSAIKIGGSGGTSCSLDANNGTFSTYGFIAVGTLVAPPTGSQTAYASWGSTQDEAAICAVTYTGVDQATPKGTTATNSGTGTASTVTATVNVSTTSGDVVVDCVAGYHQAPDTATIVAGAGQNNREEEESIDGYTAIGISDETATGTTTTMSWDFTFGTSNVYAWATRAFVLNAASAGGAIQGTLSVTLANVTLSSAGTVENHGTLSRTLAAATLAATGTVELQATLAKTLANATLSSTGTVAISGTLSRTLANLTSTGGATGTVAIAGTDSTTLGNLTLSATGQLSIQATLTKTLGNVTLTGTGILTDGPTGSLTATLANIGLAATGALDIAGALTSSLASLSLASTIVAGDGTQTARVGGDDYPRPRHRGWDEKRARLKLKKDQDFGESVLAIYRALTQYPATAKRAAELVAPPIVKRNDESATQYRKREQERENAFREERLRNLSVEKEIALRMLFKELRELQEIDDEIAIERILSEVL